MSVRKGLLHFVSARVSNLYSAGKKAKANSESPPWKKKPLETRSRSQSIGESKTVRTLSSKKKYFKMKFFHGRRKMAKSLHWDLVKVSIGLGALNIR